MSIEPLMVLNNCQFEKHTRNLKTFNSATKPLEDVAKQAKKIEILIISHRGSKDDLLTEIYALYSFFQFNAKDLEAGLKWQQKASLIVEENYGQLSEKYIERISEQALTLR